MIIIDDKCLGLELLLKAFFAEFVLLYFLILLKFLLTVFSPTSFFFLSQIHSRQAQKPGSEMVFSDFDDATIAFRLTQQEYFFVELTWGCIKTFLEIGSKEYLEEVYKDFDLKTSDNSICIRVEMAQIPEDDAEKGFSEFKLFFYIFLSTNAYLILFF